MSTRISVSFFSNFLNPHQMPLCTEMHARLGDRFKFIECKPMNPGRLALGWGTDTDRPFAVKAYQSQSHYQYALRLGYDSDVAIIGSAPDVFVKERLRRNKLTLRYSERLFKNGFWRILSPRTLIGMFRMHTGLRNRNYHMLCASGYTALDCARIFAYPDKMYKWGYFPEAREHDVTALMAGKAEKTVVQLLWVGRFMALKHTEAAVAVAARLKAEGYVFRMNIIGAGEREGYLRMLVNRQGLADNVFFLGTMPPEKVRDHMEEADIFLLTSDFREGWGAVLNESMNSGCAIVASHAAGSVPFLLEHGKSGLIYKFGDGDDLYRKVKYFLDNPTERVRMGSNACATIAEAWNPRVAAENLISLSESMVAGQAALPPSGPCSKAEPLMPAKILKEISVMPDTGGPA